MQPLRPRPRPTVSRPPRRRSRPGAVPSAALVVAATFGLLAGVLSTMIGPLPAGAATVPPFDIRSLVGAFSPTDIDGTIVVGSNGHPAAFDLGSSDPTVIDLGTLAGGTRGTATAVSGSVVVGYAETGPSGGPTHAVAYDLAADDPHLIDLGTFGGTSSRATGVDGTIVVGYSYLAGDVEIHAFAYDVAAATPELIDLGTLGGRTSFATAVDGTVVVGEAETETDGSRAFAYDLASATPTMLDLGTLGGWSSAATDVDDGVVVGSAALSDPDPTEHAFAFDLEADSPIMIDLGTMGERSSTAVAIDGNIVVGRSYTPDDIESRAFAYDLGAANPTMIGVGPVGQRYTYATAVDGSIVVGFSRMEGRRPALGFAYDLAAPSPALIDLGAFGGVSSRPVAVAGGYVVGQADDVRGDVVNALWSMAPTTRLVPGEARVVEGAGQTTVELPITLTAAVPVTVAAAWRTMVVPGVHPGQASDDGDYLRTNGTVVIPPGQTTGTVTVTVTGDEIPEIDEYVVVAFSNPMNAAIGGFWGLGFITIEDDDQPAVLPGTTSVVEGDSGTTLAQVPLTLSNASDLPVTVPWTTLHVPGGPTGQADPSSDYHPASGTVTFAPGQTSATVTVEISGDTIAEPDEYLVVSFHDPINAKMGGIWGLGTVAIVDDE